VNEIAIPCNHIKYCMVFFTKLLTLYRSEDGLVNGLKLVT